MTSHTVRVQHMTVKPPHTIIYRSIIPLTNAMTSRTVRLHRSIIPLTTAMTIIYF